MSDGYLVESILALDVGSIFTRAVLLDVVEGQYRLIARSEVLSTARPPQFNSMLGAARAVAQIESRLGRPLLDKQARLLVPERADGAGVDACVTSSSAGSPLRVFLAGLSNDFSLASARKAVLGCSAVVVGSLSLEDGVDRPAGVEMALNRLEQAEPEAIVLVGGVEEGAPVRLLDLAGVLALGYRVMQQRERPPLLYAGNTSLRPDVIAAFEGLAETKVLDNVRPAMDIENVAPLTAALQEIYAERQMSYVPGLAGVAGWSRVPLVPTSQAQNYVLRYLAAQYGLNVIGLEVGGLHTSIGWATRDNNGFVARNDWGAALSDRIMSEAGPQRLARWLPDDCESEAALEIARNLSLYPGVAPGTRCELQVMQAVAREALFPLLSQARAGWGSRDVLEDPRWDLIVMSGKALTRSPSAGQMALLALDTLQPVGISGLVVDALALTPALGAVATLEPLAASQVLDRDGFVSLGTIVAPVGSGRAGDMALRVKITYPDEHTLQVEVRAGSIEVIPLGPGQKASLELRPAGRFDLGWERKGRKATVEVDGGLLGVVVDARGRPLPSIEDAAMRRRMQQWLLDVGG
jgi:hypothetical protein